MFKNFIGYQTPNELEKSFIGVTDKIYDELFNNLKANQNCFEESNQN